MASSHSISLNCPVPGCTGQFKTKRAKDCLRVHLRDSTDEDHKEICIARYSDHQGTNPTVHACHICGRIYKKKSRLERHYKSHRNPTSRCPQCYKTFKYPLSDHLNRGRCKAKPGLQKPPSTARKTKRADLQYPHTNPLTLTPDITEQHARQSRPAETARNDTLLPIQSELGVATTPDVRMAASVLSTLQQDGAALPDAEHFRPSTNSTTNDFQNLPLNIDHTTLLHTNARPTGGYTDGMGHQIALPPTDAARCIGGNVDIPPQESHQSSAAPASVLQDLTEYHPGADRDAPLNSHRVDFRWFGVFGITWDSDPSQGEPFNGEMVDQPWTGSSGSTSNPDLNQGLLSHDQTANQQWLGIFGNGWHSCLYVPTSEQASAFGGSVGIAGS